MEYRACIIDGNGKEIMSVVLPSEGAAIRLTDALVTAMKETLSTPRPTTTGFREGTQE